MGRRKKEYIELNKLIYTDFINQLNDLVLDHWKKIVNTSSLEISIPPQQLLLYFPSFPFSDYNPEIFLIIKEENDFVYLMSKLGSTNSVQIFIIHTSHVTIEDIFLVTNPINFDDTFKSPIIAIECPDSLKEEYFLKNLLLKDKLLSKYISSDFKYML